MNPIIKTLKEFNIDEAKVSELFQALTDNPMMAMALIQGLGIPADRLQELIMTIMTNPDLIKEAVDELGLDFSKVEEAKSKLVK